MTQGPALLVVVAGTGTDVGKTWVGCQLVTELRAKGLRVPVSPRRDSGHPFRERHSWQKNARE